MRIGGIRVLFRAPKIPFKDNKIMTNIRAIKVSKIHRTTLLCSVATCVNLEPVLLGEYCSQSRIVSFLTNHIIGFMICSVQSPRPYGHITDKRPRTIQFTVLHICRKANVSKQLFKKVLNINFTNRKLKKLTTVTFLLYSELILKLFYLSFFNDLSFHNLLLIFSTFFPTLAALRFITK